MTSVRELASQLGYIGDPGFSRSRLVRRGPWLAVRHLNPLARGGRINREKGIDETEPHPDRR